MSLDSEFATWWQLEGGMQQYTEAQLEGGPERAAYAAYANGRLSGMRYALTELDTPEHLGIAAERALGNDEGH